jgi:ABC-2 type transport system ATP-binding protein
MADRSKEQTVIAVHDLHKEFMLPHQRKTSLKQVFVNFGHKNYKTHQHVLKGINFEVKEGEFFGIVGRNGSGKSTLLKMLAGVYRPTSGTIDIRGELTPFIELGVGFNPELSGRDNIYLNGALLGFSRKDMDAMYDEIVAFSELQDFMDQKLKNYSSGMQVRLAFSIAIKAHNDILIFDEVLAVGDEAFQRKCLDVFEKYKATKQTVILVTHDMETVRQFCDRAILISDGNIIKDGDPREIADEYSRLNQRSIDKDTAAQDSAPAEVSLRTELFDASKKPSVSFTMGDDIHLKLTWKANPAIDSLVVDIFKRSGEHVGGFKSVKDGVTLNGDKSEAWITVRGMFAAGKYHFLVSARDKRDKEVETLYEGAEFSIIRNWKKAGKSWSGLTPIDHAWMKVE